MKNLMPLLVSAACAITAVVASPASAAVFDITYGTALNAEITTAPSTGTTQTITGITGTFLGSAITGIIANPYSPATDYYTDLNQKVYATPTAPVTTDPIYEYYAFDNLLLTGNTLDSSGLLFQTSTNVANLFTSGTTQLVYTPRGTNAAATTLSGSFSIAPAAMGAVPEPASWAMMILGMGAVGYAMRSAKRRSDDKFDAKIKKITYGAIA